MDLIYLKNFSYSGKMYTAEVGRSPQLQMQRNLWKEREDDGETARLHQPEEGCSV